MERYVTQADVEGELVRIMQLLELETGRYAGLIEELAKARCEYQFARAKAYKEAKGTIPERMAETDLATSDEAFAYEMAAARERATRELLESLRANLGALQTISANIRAQT